MSNSLKYIYQYLTVKNNNIKVQSMQRISKISLLALVLLNFSYANSGSIFCYDCNISAGNLTHSGTIKGINSVNLKAGTLSGDGKIQGPDITIVCDEFKFSGLISCDNRCIIYAKKDFDVNMFKREGQGLFKIIICPYNVRHFNRKDLAIEYYSYFYSNCFSLDKDLIDNVIKEIRTQAALNSIDDKVALQDINSYLRYQVNFHRARLGQKRDTDSLYSGLGKCALAAMGLGIAYVLFKNEQYLTTLFGTDEYSIISISTMLAGCSAFPIALSYVDFYNWVNPRHREKYEAFSLIMSRIEHALKTDRIPEEKIIRL